MSETLDLFRCPSHGWIPEVATDPDWPRPLDPETGEWTKVRVCSIFLPPEECCGLEVSEQAVAEIRPGSSAPL
jgi:hypothetical protein